MAVDPSPRRIQEAGCKGKGSAVPALVAIYGVTLIDVLGTMIMVPLLPYVAQHYGASGFVVGALLTTSAVAGAVAAPVWGAASDRLGRKRIVLISQTISLIGYVVLALSHSLALLFVARAVAGFGSGGVGVTQSYIADVIDEAHRGRAYAIFGAVFGLAIVLGPVVGGFLIAYGFWAPFAAAALFAAVTIALALRFLPTVGAQGARTGPRRALDAVLRGARVRGVIVRHFLFIFAVTSFFSVFALFLGRQLGLGPREASWLLAGAGCAGGLGLVLVVGPVAKRLGDAGVAQAGLVLLVLAYAALTLTTNLWVFAAVLAVWAIGAACVEPTLTALLSRVAPVEERGAVMGFNDAASNVALMIAPLVGGAAFDLDPRAVGIVPAVAALVALVLGALPEREGAARSGEGVPRA